MHEKVLALRAELRSQNLDAMLIGRGDRFQGEEVQPGEERLAWLTGFSGSAGLALLGLESATLLVDSRYTLQAPKEVDGAFWQVAETPATRLRDLLKQTDPSASVPKLAYDPWLFSAAEIRSLAQEAEGAGWALVPLETNPIDALWTDRPKPAAPRLFSVPPSLHGRGRAEKLKHLAEGLQEAGAEHLLIARADTVNWALNVRGRDLEHSPLLLSYLLVSSQGEAAWYLPQPEGLALPGVSLKAEADLLSDLANLNGKVLLDPSRTAQALFEAVPQAQRAQQPCPAHAQQIRKTHAEIQGMQDCHLRDGAAMVRVLRWLDRELAPRLDAGRPIMESEVEQRALAERERMSGLIGTSFSTIAAAGANGAMAHYRANPESDSPLLPGSTLVFDSGGQYESGTTDITRTVWLGGPVPDVISQAYTRVLMGMIDLSLAHVPSGTQTAALDALARRPLWDAGLTYGHGTGHGVGAGLLVHETPPSFSPVPTRSTPLAPGLILSNEPGYYKEGAFGIRIENLVWVREAAKEGWLEFGTLTYAPIDLTPVRWDLLEARHLQWLETYAQEMARLLNPYLDAEERAWLQKVGTPPAL